MNITFDAECGCGFALERSPSRRSITLRSEGRTLTRDYPQSADHSFWEIADFLVSVPVAAREDRQHGTPGANLVDTTFHDAEVGLLAVLEVVGPQQNTIRATFVLDPSAIEDHGLDETRVQFHVDLDALLAVTSVVDLY